MDEHPEKCTLFMLYLKNNFQKLGLKNNTNKPTVLTPIKKYAGIFVQN